MAVPKRKTSKSRKGMRRSKHALKAVSYCRNSFTGELSLPHRASLDGYYGNRKVLDRHRKPKSADAEE